MLEHEDYQDNANRIYFCESCQRDIQSQNAWENHLKSWGHRSIIYKRVRKDRMAKDREKESETLDSS